MISFYKEIFSFIKLLQKKSPQTRALIRTYLGKNVKVFTNKDGKTPKRTTPIVATINVIDAIPVSVGSSVSFPSLKYI